MVVLYTGAETRLAAANLHKQHNWLQLIHHANLQ